MNSKDFIFKYITGPFNLLIFIGIFGCIFSFAILVRLELMEKYNYLLLKNFNQTQDLQVMYRNLIPMDANFMKNINNTTIQVNKNQRILDKIYLEQANCMENYKKNEQNLLIDKSCFEYCRFDSCKKLVQNLCGDNSWILYKDTCLKLFDEKLSWSMAHTSCKSINSTLLTTKEKNYQNIINNLVLDLNFPEDRYFIGLKRSPRNKQDWFWIDGEYLKQLKKNHNWNPGEPNNSYDEENCAELIISKDKKNLGKWNDINCDTVSRKYICEKKLNILPIESDDFLFEYLKHKDIQNENLNEFLDELYKLTDKNGTFYSKSQLDSLSTILEKISNMPLLEIHSCKIFFKILDNILKAPENIFQENSKSSNKMINSIDKLVRNIAINKTYTNKLNYISNNFIVNLNDFDFMDPEIANSVNYLPITQELFKSYENSEENLASIFINSKLGLKNSSKNNLKKVFFPNELETIVGSVQQRISIIYFKTQKLFQSTKNVYYKIANPVVSVNIHTLSNYTRLVNKNILEYQIYLKLNDSIEINSLKCAWWKLNSDNEGFWSTEGCQYFFYDSIRYIHKCVCNHSNVALLYNTVNEIDLKEYWLSKSIIFIGLFLSSIGLVITIVTYINFNTFCPGVIHRVLIILSSTLLISNILYTLTSFVTPSMNLNCCITVGVLLHYFLLCSFLLMLVISVAQFLAFVKIFDNYIENFSMKFSLFAFGLPVIIPLIILSTEPNIYLNKNQSTCWLHSTGLYVSFIGPVCFILVLNLAFFVSIIISRCNREIKFRNGINLSKNQIVFSILCFIFISSTWLIGLTLIVEYEYKLMSEITFSVLSILEGVFIFLFHLVLSKSKQDIWRLFLRNNILRKSENYNKNPIFNNKSVFKPILKKEKGSYGDFDKKTRVFSVSAGLYDINQYGHYYAKYFEPIEEYLVENNQFLFKPIRKSQVSFATTANSSFLPYMIRQDSNIFNYPLSSSKHFYTDDVSVRISKLNESLNRIKAFNHEFAQNTQSASFRITELPTLFFD